MFTDGYSQAIPVLVLQAAAAGAAPVCACHGDSARRRCATALVRRQVCPCLLGEHCIIEAIADDVSHQVAARRSPQTARAAAWPARGRRV